MRMVRPWPRLPRGAVAAPSLAGFKAGLDGALSTLGWWKGSLPRAECWNEMVFKAPSKSNHSRILWQCSIILPRSAGDGCRRLSVLSARAAPASASFIR